MSTFSGFSEEDLERIKSGETQNKLGPQKVTLSTGKKIEKLGFKSKRAANSYKLPMLQKLNSDDSIDDIDFAKCKLSLRSPSAPNDHFENNESDKENLDKNMPAVTEEHKTVNGGDINAQSSIDSQETTYKGSDRKDSIEITPDMRGPVNYSEDELANHKLKLEQLQLRQKLMEEQNKKRKEMLAKALADRTKQTTEEVMRLEKIKKELQVLDSQFSQDVSVLREKIDQACWSYAEAEKHYLKVEKEFLQAKIHLQKEKEKKELLTEHLCALITHNETRKAQKLETLMLELATDKKKDIPEEPVPIEDDTPVIVDGVDEKTGKIVEITPTN